MAASKKKGSASVAPAKSPLAGLKDSGVKVVPLTAEQRALHDAVLRIIALAELLEKSNRWDESVRLSNYDREHRSEFSMMTLDTREREPSSWLAFNRTGHVVEHSCDYSGHNGDSYNHKERVLEPAEALQRLQGLAHMLEGRALAMEERRLEEAAHRHRQELARSNLNARLRGKGIV